ncbi:LIS-1 2 [Chaetomium fimeti]|uniref:Nuclear distribution protein PAC1 n=1 Tax=Chaetomium fimeti TaxID=1854472 RepID=A0AAE0HGK4_9PEZI|nr:LIS-1 2 [Chaetomium fimeti]
MRGILTGRQADELHKSIIAYLSANNLSSVATTLRTELGLGEDAFDSETATKYQTLLEKKWTGAARLQKKAMDLEFRNNALQSEVDNAATASLSKPQDPAEWLPRSPPRYLLESHQAIVNCIAFHPAFSVLASGSDDYTIKIWDWELGELERTLKGHTKAVLDVDYGGPTGGILLASCSSDSTIKLWDPADDYKNIRTLSGHEHSISAVRFVPGGIPGHTNLLASASGDKTLRLWDATTGFCIRTLTGHTGWVRDVCPSPDGHYLLSAGSDQTARLWAISPTTTPQTNPDNTNSTNDDNLPILTGHTNGIQTCTFAPPSTHPYLAALANHKKPPPTTGATATSPPAYAATGSRDKTIRLWDTRSGTCFATLAGHDNWVNGVVFHPGGRYLLSVGDDRTCVRVLGGGVHGGFVTCLRLGGERGGERGGEKWGDDGVQIRGVVATGEGLYIVSNPRLRGSSS